MLAAVERVLGSVPVERLTPILEAPSDLHRQEICAVSGMAVGEACPTRVSEWLPRDASVAGCTWHHATDRGPITIWPQVFRDWARDAGLLTEDARPRTAAPIATHAANSATRSPDPHSALAIARPLGGAVFLLDPTLRPEFQALRLSARGSVSGRLEWFVDGVSVAIADRDEVVRWPLVPGRHTVRVRDERGASAETWVEVR
jgi:membrane carboxypeptidase/penicillin-binding protein PbpC